MLADLGIVGRPRIDADASLMTFFNHFGIKVDLIESRVCCPSAHILSIQPGLYHIEAIERSDLRIGIKALHAHKLFMVEGRIIDLVLHTVFFNGLNKCGNYCGIGRFDLDIDGHSGILEKLKHFLRCGDSYSCELAVKFISEIKMLELFEGVVCDLTLSV